METYMDLKPLVNNPDFQNQKQESLCGFSYDMIDLPITDIIKGLNDLSCCFTLQCCYGHFLYPGQEDPHNLEPLKVQDGTDDIEYRITYVAVCIENSEAGKKLYRELKKIPDSDPDNIQFFCASWFWEKQVNSYALQIEPDRFKHLDRAILNAREALNIEKLRPVFFNRLKEVITSF